jgi:probable F420-dependent oxidoreductase
VQNSESKADTGPVLLGLPPARYPGAGAGAILDTARAAEDAGFAGIVLSEHMIMGNRTDRYPWGTFPDPPEAPWLEPLTTLAAIGAVTSTLRLGTGILIAPIRAAAVLAKTAATVDALTRGRLDLGVGTGWQQEEFEAVGADHAARGRLLTDTIAACRALWGPSPASFSSETVSFKEVWCEPKPYRPGGPTVLFSGTLTPRNVRRITELGDGWVPIMGEPPDGVAAGVRVLREAFAAAGRSASELQVRAHLPVAKDASGRPGLARTLERVPELLASGATDLVVPLAAYVRTEDALAGWFSDAAACLGALR